MNCIVGCNSQKSPAFKDSLLSEILMFNLSLLQSHLQSSSKILCHLCCAQEMHHILDWLILIKTLVLLWINIVVRLILGLFLKQLEHIVA